ncbi:MAG: SMC-Scp complex subunit ScpB [Planctomycetes bacterium]|nr:SMC-Scp complex subunit ScpB [Planctomycetota bacterium]
MGDISREPLPSGPRSNSGSGKGPSELIRYEDLSAEPSGASASGAESREPDARDDAALGGDARDESFAESPAPELSRSVRMSVDPLDEPGSSAESNSARDASPPRFEPGFETAFEPIVPLDADPFDVEQERLHPEPVGGVPDASGDTASDSEREAALSAAALSEAALSEAVLSEAVLSEAVLSEAGLSEPVPSEAVEPQTPAEPAAAPAEGEPSSAELAADLEVSEAELALDVTMGPPAADPALAPPSSAAEELADEAPDLHEPGEIARVALAVLVSTREPMSVLRLAELVQAAPSEVEAGLERLAAELRAQGFPLELLQIDGAYRIATSPAVYPYLVRLKKLKKAERLTPAALETLAVIAYRQPVIRAEIEAIRGVKAGPVLKSLLDHKLVRVVGRADVPGHPLQYGTSQLFLDRFGLRSLEDLPSVQELKSLGG